MSSAGSFSRRRFIGAAAGVAGAAALSPQSAVATGGGGGGGGGHHDDHDHDHGRGPSVVTRDHIGLQQWSIRDAITRLDGSVTGYLGGRGFPYDPTDLGPAVPLPGGFASVFRYLASVGYRGFEFYSFNQGANGAITMEQLRSALDRAGLVAAGSLMDSDPEAALEHAKYAKAKASRVPIVREALGLVAERLQLG